MTVRQHQIAAPVETILDLHPAVYAIATTTLSISGTSYAIALPRAGYAQPVIRALFNVSAPGAGTVVGEVGIGTSAASVLGSAGTTIAITPQIVQSLAAVTLTATGLKNVAIGAGYTVAAGVQAWLLFRTALATTQPTFAQFPGVAGLGACRNLAASGVLTVGSPLSFASTTVNAPAIMLGSV